MTDNKLSQQKQAAVITETPTCLLNLEYKSVPSNVKQASLVCVCVCVCVCGADLKYLTSKCSSIITAIQSHATLLNFLCTMNFLRDYYAANTFFFFFWKSTTKHKQLQSDFICIFCRMQTPSQCENGRNVELLTFFWYHTTASFTLEAIYISLLPA